MCIDPPSCMRGTTVGVFLAKGVAIICIFRCFCACDTLFILQLLFSYFCILFVQFADGCVCVCLITKRGNS